MKKVLYFDVEWANGKNRSICQMGLMCEDFDTGEPIYPELNLYVDPDDDFDTFCVKVHHITQEKVAKCKTFNKVWDNIKNYFENSIVIGHNVKSADLDALVKNLRRYNIKVPTFRCLDTYTLAMELISPTLVNKYSLSSLCEYYGIDIDNEHDAFDDACACSELLKSIIEDYGININEFTTIYTPNDTKEFERYYNTSTLVKELKELFGFLLGIKMDGVISKEEKEYLINWYDKYQSYNEYKEIIKIIKLLEDILKDGIVTTQEISKLRSVLAIYVYSLEGRKETTSLQELQGIVNGIIVDYVVNDEEIINLSKWLYENEYLEGNYPYDKIISSVKKILEDNKISEEERQELKTILSNVFEPINQIKKILIDFEGKSFCLTGEFKYGSRNKVSKYIEDKGGIIHDIVKKTTNYVVVGEYGSCAYCNGSYGTKVKKAMELGITVVKEEQMFI